MAMCEAKEYSPKVSIIIPLYNQEKYFGKCISSVCKQTYQNLEIIVINDGSTDGSLSLAQKWARKDNRIIVIDKKNEGASKARVDGLKIASGEFFTPVDSDDYLPKDAIEILAGHMIDKDVDVVLGSMARVLGWIKRKNNYDYGTFPFNQVVYQPELQDDYYLGFFGKPCFPIMMCSRLYRMSAVHRALEETELWTDELPFVGEDHFFNLKLFPYLRSMYRTKENVYYYRIGGMSSDRFSPGYIDLLKLSDIRLKLLDERQLEDGYGSLFEEYADCVYYHAQQLLEYKKADKDGVIAFFENELTTRSVALRLIEFFTNNVSEKQGISLMVNHDYEGMYEYAYYLMKRRCGSLKNRLVHVLMKLIDIL